MKKVFWGKLVAEKNYVKVHQSEAEGVRVTLEVDKGYCEDVENKFNLSFSLMELSYQLRQEALKKE